MIVFALFSMLGGIVVFVTSLMLITALRKEYEKKIVPWLYSFAIFTLFRLFAFIFFSIVNDMIFAYNIMMCLLWIIFVCISAYGWLVVYSLYLELRDLTKLEDLAHLRVWYIYFIILIIYCNYNIWQGIYGYELPNYLKFYCFRLVQCSL